MPTTEVWGSEGKREGMKSYLPLLSTVMTTAADSTAIAELAPVGAVPWPAP